MIIHCVLSGAKGSSKDLYQATKENIQQLRTDFPEKSSLERGGAECKGIPLYQCSALKKINWYKETIYDLRAQSIYSSIGSRPLYKI